LEKLSFLVVTKLKVCFSLLIFVISNRSFSQVEHLSSARILSLGGCGVMLKDAGSTCVNPGILAHQPKLSSALNYQNNFFTKDLQNTSFSIAGKLKNGGVGIGVRTYGTSVFKQLEVSGMYGLRFDERFSLGIALGVNSIFIQNYGSKNNLNVSVGIYGKLNHSLVYACSFRNLENTNSFLMNHGSLPPKILVGLQFISSEKVSIYSEIEKTISYPMRIKVAVEYFTIKHVAFRFGIANSGYLVSYGIGYKPSSDFRIDLGATWQPILGASIHAGVVFELRELIENE
jgi:hypothetical protein